MNRLSAGYNQRRRRPGTSMNPAVTAVRGRRRRTRWAGRKIASTSRPPRLSPYSPPPAQAPSPPPRPPPQALPLLAASASSLYFTLLSLLAPLPPRLQHIAGGVAQIAILTVSSGPNVASATSFRASCTPSVQRRADNARQMQRTRAFKGRMRLHRAPSSAPSGARRACGITSRAC